MTAVESNTDAVTRILADLRVDPEASHRLLPIIYEELHGIAKRVFAVHGSAKNVVQPTILVHDVFMKLVQKTDIKWESRAHFFAVAAKATRDLLVDHARRENAEKRGGEWHQTTLAGLETGPNSQKCVSIIDLEEALKQLGKVAPRQEQIVEMRFFGGLRVDEVAHVLNVSERTVMYDWRMARAWLRSRLED
jgi:RNA polymerase sigma-70 factor, ECF subfamily